MQAFIVHFHSGWRWMLLLLLIIAILNNWKKWRSNGSWSASDGKWNMHAMSAAHLQLLTGLYLFFTSTKVQFHEMTMKDSVLRFYAVEHLVMMLLAVALITIGYVKAKRQIPSAGSFKTGFWYYTIALLVILAGIPWPWRQMLGGGWF